MRLEVGLGAALAIAGLVGCGGSGSAGGTVSAGSGTTVAATIYGPNPKVGVGELSVLANGSISAMNSIVVSGLTPSGPILQGIAVDSAGEICVGE
jgi:hypothetical protein